MNNTEEAARTNAAVLAQLNAEITAHGFNVKSLAKTLDVDYNTFLRYVNGERHLPLLTLWAVLAQLDVPIDVFMLRAKDRIKHG